MRRFCQTVALAAATALLVPTAAASAQAITGPGWEAFPKVEYRGGDSRAPKRKTGVLVLDDSSLVLYSCPGGDCMTKDGSQWRQEGVVLRIDLKRITGLSASSSYRDASATDRVMLGVLAKDREEGVVVIEHEAENSIETPVFKAGDVTAAAITGKVRYRLRKIGVDLKQ